MKRTVRQLMKSISLNEVPKIQEEATIEQALILLERFQTDALLVMRGENLKGLFSEKDLAKVALFRKNHRILELNVAEAMSSKLVGVSPDYRLDECMAVMTSMGIRNLPVIENDKPIALLNLRHIMEALIQDREFIIGELVKYVTGVNGIGGENNGDFIGNNSYSA